MSGTGDTAAAFTADTIVAAFWDQASRFAARPALRRRGPQRWEALSWSDYADLVRELAAGLVGLGVGAGDPVAILAANRVEWHALDLAAMTIGAVTVPIYQTSSAEQVHYVLSHSESRVCVVDDDEQLTKVRSVRARLPKLDHVVVIDAAPQPGELGMTGYEELRALGRQVREERPTVVADLARQVRPDQLATLVYTSGTTGPPKGTMITHANIAWTIRSVLTVVDVGPSDRFISFLPLSHIAERIVSHFGQIASGGETWFARSLTTVAEDLKDCRPTVFFGVPRVWEKLHEAVTAKLAELPQPRRFLARRYVDAGQKVVSHEQDRAALWPHQRLEHRVLDALVGSKLRAELGLDRARLLGTAAAPISPDLLRWFHAVGLRIVEIYGQTEDCGPATINPPTRNRIGTVGLPIPGLSIRVADDGEILVKGGSVCAGYHQDPDATAALIDAEGWMHTGDVGRLDPDGYLHITDRKKDIIITAAGQNVAPQPIETQLRAEPLIGQSVVVGDGRRYLVALLTLDPAELATWAEHRGKPIAPEALTRDPDVEAAVAAAVERVNQRNARVEGIKRFRILPHEFTVTEGELTPTLKVRRRKVIEHYADVIEMLYAEEEER